MPLPISPVGQINSYDNIFPNTAGDESYANKRFVQDSNVNDIVELLEKIDKHQDNIVNAAADAISANHEKYYNVPPYISDEILLKLKTAGYCLGSGRTVRFSDKAKGLLKKKYLCGDNSFKANRVKKKII